RMLGQGRLAAIGKAAQTLHPAAGHGLNVGPPDTARPAPGPNGRLSDPAADPAPALAGFAGPRSADPSINAGLTDLLPPASAPRAARAPPAAGAARLVRHPAPRPRNQ